MPNDSMQVQINKSIHQRLAALEQDSHKPFDFTALVDRIEALETATSVALATPAALHRAREAQYQYAKLAWEKIKENLVGRHVAPLLNGNTLLAESEREIDEEQIEVIRMHMGGNR